ncbi:MAG: hypothetical protein AB9834_10460 [Lentimicrobium sp.]
MMIKVILIAIVLVGISIAGIAVKMFFIKGSEFKKSCGSVDPSTGKKIGCTCSTEGAPAGSCDNKVV